MVAEPRLESDPGAGFSFRQKLGFFLGPAVFLAVLAAPLSGLSPQAHRLAAIISLTVVLWITEAIPLAAAALLGPALCVLLNVVPEAQNPAKEILRSFADPIIFVFIGGFLLAEGMMRHGLDRRIAFRVLGLPWVGESPRRILIAFALVTGGISMWISNTATTAMMFPIGLAILAEMARLRSASVGREVSPGSLPLACGLMLTASFASSVGGMATPVGTPPNLVGLSQIKTLLGIEIPFFQWMLIGLPLSLLLIAFLVVVLGRTCPAVDGGMEGARAWIQSEKAKLGSLRRGEINVLAAFGVTVILWILPGALAALAPGAEATKALARHVPEAAAALVGASLLFLLPVDWRSGEFTITWDDAKRIDWGTVLLFGGGLALGDLMTSTKLADWIGGGLAGLLNAKSGLALTILFALLATVVSEACSNVASATMVVPLAIAVSRGAGVDAFAPALAACLGSSLGFMLPVSTPPNAIVHGSGYIPLPKMVRYGVLLDVVGVVLVVVLVTLLAPVVARR